MSFLSNLKGYFRRATTPKKEENYTPEETTYGDIEVRYIHSVLLNKSISNIILEISFDKNNKDAENTYNIFLDIISESGLLKTKYVTKNKIFIYTGGSVSSYELLINKYYFNPENAYNKILRKVYNILKEIDIMNENGESDKVYPYESEYQTIKAVNPVYTENIDSNYLSSEVVNDKEKDIFSYLINVMVISIYTDSTTITQYIPEFVNSYNNNLYEDYIHQSIEDYRDKFYSNFEIYGYKNIFDINFRLSNSLYEDDTEEIIG